MPMTAMEKRAARRERNQTSLDMNLVSLIDVFTILIFFLLANVGAAELITNSQGVQLPESAAEAQPRETVVVSVSGKDIHVDGRKVAEVGAVMAMQGDLIEPLREELARLSQRQVVRQEKAALAKAVTIMGDKEIPYQLLRKVMITCARADYAEVAFAVNRKHAS